MSGEIRNERVTAKIEDEIVVFLIGMRINRWWKPHKWIPVALAMPRMLKELFAQPELGLIDARTWPGRVVLVIQYWRSMDQLMDYAKSRDSTHLPAWRAFNKAIGTNGDVGIWHETYRIRPGHQESIYVNMPPFGLGLCGDLVPAHGKRDDARGRLNAKEVTGVTSSDANDSEA